jgi:Ca2+-binding EF-hand superfamily protein
MVLMPSIRPEEPAAPMLPPTGGSGSGADNDESRLAEIEAKLAVSLKPPTPEPEIEPSPEELARIREQELAKLLAEEEAAAKEKARLEQERVDRERIQAREAKAEAEAESRRQAEAKAHADREKEAARRAKAEASAQAHQLHEQRDAQLTETYAATKIQAGARGAMARRSAAERMAKIELSKDEKLVKMVDNVFRVIRQHMKSDRKLYGKTLADAAEAFRVMDKDNSGALDAAEFGGALKRMGFGLTAEQVEAVVQSVDTSGDGEIDYTEYISLLAKGDPELAETEEAQVLETRRQEARERRKAKRKAAAKKSAQMRKSSALGQTIMTADERVALLEVKAAQDAAASAVPDEEAAIKIQAAIRGRQTRVQKRKGKEAPEAPSKEAPKVSPEATKEAPKVTPLEVEDQPVQFGEGNWMPHQHSFDADTSGFGFDQEPAPAVKKPFVPPRNFAGHRSWRDWYAANEEQVSSILVPGRKIVNNDTAEIKLLKVR